jgi:hypothetical protein
MPLAFVLAACTSPDESTAQGQVVPPTRDAGALFQTDSLSYTLRDIGPGYEGLIGVRFTNTTGGTTYFENCNGATSLQLEKLVGGQWQPAWSPMIPLCLSPPITVAPGATYDSQINVFGGHPNSNTAPTFSVPDIPGVYRAVWTNALGSYREAGSGQFGPQLPFEQRVSNRFALLVTSRR